MISTYSSPAIQAEIEIIIIVSFVPWNTATTIGIKIPNVPQEVPVANARKQPTRKIIAGRKFNKPCRCRLHNSCHILCCTKTVCHSFQCPCKCQNQDCRHHSLESVWNTCHRICKLQNSSKCIENNRDHKCEEASKHQSD